MIFNDFDLILGYLFDTILDIETPTQKKTPKKEAKHLKHKPVLAREREARSD
jgi:hypothetical protein